MSPRPAPNMDERREQVVRAARSIAESSGWDAVTTRRLSQELGVSQPVLYSAFADRQAIIDAVVIEAAAELAAELATNEVSPRARMQAYLTFAANNPRAYEAMFSLPLGLTFASKSTPAPLRKAFANLRAVFPDSDGTRTEIAWATLHGLATLGAGDRLREHEGSARFELAHAMLTAHVPAD
jgi:AcrR family transcriptional regulator